METDLESEDRTATFSDVSSTTYTTDEVLSATRIIRSQLILIQVDKRFQCV